MKRPPMLVTLKFRSGTENSRQISLWVPLFLVIPVLLLLMLALIILLLPFFVVYVLLSWDFRWWRYLRYGVPALFQTLHALLGLKVDVEDRNQQFYIDVN